MTQLELVRKKPHLPSYLAYPISIDVLEASLSRLPQATITVEFFAGNAKQSARGAHKDHYKEPNSGILTARHACGRWHIDIYACHPDKISQIRKDLVETGLQELSRWFAQTERSGVTDPHHVSYSKWTYFCISFDGEQLVFTQRDPWESA